MSVVTDVILMVPLAAIHVVEQVNRRIAEIVQRPDCGLARVDSFAGGSKAVQAAIYMGAFSYLPRQAILDAVVAAPWHEYDRDNVQIAIKEEWDDAFTVHGLAGLPDDAAADDLVFEAPVALEQARDRELEVRVPRALLRRIVAQHNYALGFLREVRFRHQATADVNAGYVREMEATLARCHRLAGIDPDEDLDD